MACLLMLALTISALAAPRLHADDETAVVPSPDDTVVVDSATATGLPSPPSSTPAESAPAPTPPPLVVPEFAPGGHQVDSPAPISPRLPSLPSEGSVLQTPATNETPALPAPDQSDAPAEWSGTLGDAGHLATTLCTSLACCGLPALGILVSGIIFVIPYGSLVAIPLALLSMLGGCPAAVVAPAVGTWVGAIWGEWLGGIRGAALWPTVVAYSVETASVMVAALGLGIGSILVGGAVLAAIDPGFVLFGQNPVFTNESIQSALPTLAAGSGVLIFFPVGLLLAVIAPPVASYLSYGWFADPKEPDDTGFRLPGIFSANGITPEEREENRLEQEREQLEREEKLRIQDKKQEEWKLKQKEREKEREKKKGPKAGEPLPVSHPFRY